jgi:hypothetical protein
MITSKSIKNFEPTIIQNIVNFINEANVLNIFKNNYLFLSEYLGSYQDSFLIQSYCGDIQIIINNDNIIRIKTYPVYFSLISNYIKTLEDLKKVFKYHNISTYELYEYLLMKESEMLITLESTEEIFTSIDETSNTQPIDDSNYIF